MTYPLAGFVGINRASKFDVTMSLLTGEENMSRMSVAAMPAMTNGMLRLQVFRAKRWETITQVRMLSGTTAGIGLTDAWMVAYEVVQSGSTWVANLIAQTATDPTLFTAASTAYTRPFAAPFYKLGGHYYAVGCLLLGATTSPAIMGSATQAGMSLAGEMVQGPPLQFTQTGLAAPPAQQAIPGNSNVAASAPYAVLLP